MKSVEVITKRTQSVPNSCPTRAQLVPNSCPRGIQGLPKWVPKSLVGYPHEPCGSCNHPKKRWPGWPRWIRNGNGMASHPCCAGTGWPSIPKRRRCTVNLVCTSFCTSFFPGSKPSVGVGTHPWSCTSPTQKLQRYFLPRPSLPFALLLRSHLRSQYNPRPFRIRAFP